MGWTYADVLTGYATRASMGMGVQSLADMMGISKTDQNKMVNFVSGIPVVGDLVASHQQRDKVEDYMKNTGVGWDSVKYPALLNAGQSSLFRVGQSGLNFISDNIGRLY